MAEYVLPVRIASTSVMLAGTMAHGTVVYLTGKAIHADNTAYLIFMRIYSIVSILRHVLGWSMTARSVGFDAGVIIIAYGVDGYLGSHFCNLVDSINSHVVNVLYIWVPAGMAFRALIAFQRTVRKKHVLITMFLLWLVQTPAAIVMIHSYAPPDNYTQFISADNQRELLEHSAYAVILTTPFENFYFNKVMSYQTYFCVPTTYLFVLITLWRVRLYRQQMSEQTARVHRAFIMLISIEATSMCLGLLVNFVKNMVVTGVIPYIGLQQILVWFAHPITAMIPAIQGWAMLALIPYFRREISKLVRKKSIDSEITIEQSKGSLARTKASARIS